MQRATPNADASGPQQGRGHRKDRQRTDDAPRPGINGSTWLHANITPRYAAKGRNELENEPTDTSATKHTTLTEGNTTVRQDERKKPDNNPELRQGFPEGTQQDVFTTPKPGGPSLLATGPAKGHAQPEIARTGGALGGGKGSAHAKRPHNGGTQLAGVRANNPGSQPAKPELSGARNRMSP